MGAEIYFGDNLEVLRGFGGGEFGLIYVDPPFNTGGERVYERVRVRRDDGGLEGFGGKRYVREVLGSSSYGDVHEDYLGMLGERFEEARRVLRGNGSMFVHVDCRESHYVKVLLDEIFGRGNFMNEIIWAYDYGGRSKRKWASKHDVIFWYAKDAEDYVFNYDEIDRVPYMAPGLVGKEKAARGKVPTDVWWNTIVPTNGRERTGYPTQKPLAIMERILRVHSNEGDKVLDFFAGSGTFGEAAIRLGREACLVDNNEEAMRVMLERLDFAELKWCGWGVGVEKGKEKEKALCRRWLIGRRCWIFG